MNDIGQVKGIGPTTAEKLKNAGFDSIPLLAAADYKDIIEKVALAPSVTQRLVESARQIIETELKEVKGVSPAIAEKLRIAGYTTASSVADANREELVENLGLLPAMAQRLINSAGEIVTEIEAEAEAAATAAMEVMGEKIEEEQPPITEKMEAIQEKVEETPPAVQIKDEAKEIIEEQLVVEVAEEKANVIEEVPSVVKVKEERVEKTRKESYSPALMDFLQGKDKDMVLSSLKQDILIRVMKTSHLRKIVVEKVTKGLFS